MGAAGVAVLHDRRRAGVSDLRGRLLVTRLRAYDVNRIGVALDDLPADRLAEADEITVVPGARAGLVVRFPLLNAGGEARVVSADGAPLAEGAMLVRAEDGARFPVGRGGRVYLSGAGAMVLTRDGGGCAVRVSPDALLSDAPLVCEAS